MPFSTTTAILVITYTAWSCSVFKVNDHESYESFFYHQMSPVNEKDQRRRTIIIIICSMCERECCRLRNLCVLSPDKDNQPYHIIESAL